MSVFSNILSGIGNFATKHADTLLSGGIGIAGNLLGALSNRSTNKSNLKINQLNNEFNERMMEKQMNYNTMMFNKMNAYNDPKAQRERLEAAGLNPSMMLGQISPGMAQSSGSVSAASAAGAVPQQAFIPDFSGIPQSILQMSQSDLLKEQKRQINIDNQTRLQQNMRAISESIARERNENAKSRNIEILNNYADQHEMITLQQQNQDLLNSIETGKNIIREGLMLDKNLAIFDEQTRLNMAEQVGRMLSMAQQRKESVQSMKESAQRIIESEAKTHGYRISNDVAKRTADAVVEKSIQETLPVFGRYGQNTGDWTNSRKYGQYK